MASVLIASLMLVACGGPPPSAERVSFRTRDGFLLDGRLFGSGTKGIVLSHMFLSDQASWYGFADELAKEGYLVLTYDFRGYGESEGMRDVVVIDRDVVAASDYLRTERLAEEVVLIGASMGGTASLVAASNSSVTGVATLSAPVEFMGLEVGRGIASFDIPKLYVAALDDPTGAAGAAEVFLRSDPTADLKIVGGDAHGTDMLVGPRGTEIRRALKDFIAKVMS